jgi:glucosamine kinase
MTDLYVGVDGGGSKTVALAASADGTLLGVGRAGTANYRLAGLPAATREVRQAIDLATAGRRPARAVLALASCDDDQDAALLGAALADVADEVVVENDTWAALFAGAPEGEGLAVVAGTHANVLAVRRGEARLRFGLGYETGNVGGGIDVWRTLLHHAFRASEGSLPADPALERFVLAMHGMSDLASLARRFRATPLAHGDHPLRVEAMRALSELEGLLPQSPLAQAAVMAVAADHAVSAAYMATRVGFPCDEPLPLVLVGGFMQPGSTYRRVFLGRLAATYPQQRTCYVPLPALGALRRAHPDGARHLPRWRSELTAS